MTTTPLNTKAMRRCTPRWWIAASKPLTDTQERCRIEMVRSQFRRPYADCVGTFEYKSRHEGQSPGDLACVGNWIDGWTGGLTTWRSSPSMSLILRSSGPQCTGSRRAYGSNGIDARRAARRKVACENRHRPKQHHNHDDRQRIVGSHPVEPRAKEAREAERERQP